MKTNYENEDEEQEVSIPIPIEEEQEDEEDLSGGDEDENESTPTKEPDPTPESFKEFCRIENSREGWNIILGSSVVRVDGLCGLALQVKKDLFKGEKKTDGGSYCG